MIQPKVEIYQGAFVGKGYHDRLRWAAFCPSIGEIHHGPANHVPIQEGLGASGLGATFSPFFQPDAPEIAYCIALSDWWRGITERPRDSVTPQQPIQRHHSMHRVHRLISETGPFVPPDGYFDCTVEVLKVYTNSTVHTMYATDYTRNNDMSGAQSNSWSSSLSEYVLQFEMWDDAAQIAGEMRPGEYYSIKNARMKINSAGQLEGKVVQDKIVKLDESDAATSIHLKALLERKKNWEAKETSLEPEISYQLIEDVKEGKFFHCTVEVCFIPFAHVNPF
ncbi:hypothetical protein GALMADRAFT_616891 [Galerina marginata CBS 339.88]|uniref:Protection of telomeres protein 1 ssDNA-binding domain-containing protein n=1 Tax=Galerina marginata (strain CBS 339.88) TaxID=685588 RepID=A0A067SRP6_GALM3|nr:hypothetical protein GALMADRAFT_616891 [Galerina marginata CBS 339.88]